MAESSRKFEPSSEDEVGDQKIENLIISLMEKNDNFRNSTSSQYGFWGNFAQQFRARYKIDIEATQLRKKWGYLKDQFKKHYDALRETGQGGYNEYWQNVRKHKRTADV